MTKGWILWLTAGCGAAMILGGGGASHPVTTPAASSSGVSSPTPEAMATAVPDITQRSMPLPAMPAAPGWLIVDASFVSANGGWLVRRDVNSTGSEVLATRDGGVSWARQYLNDDLVPSVV